MKKEKGKDMAASRYDGEKANGNVGEHSQRQGRLGEFRVGMT